MVYAEILAGGNGTRMGATDMPKQFLNIGNKPIIIHTIESFLLVNRIDKIIVVTPKKWIQHTKDIIDKYIGSMFSDKIHICEGGNNRNNSILEGLKYIEKNFGVYDDDVVLTHDAVRPFLTSRIINQNIDMVNEFMVVDTVIPAVDTIVESVNQNFISSIPQRKNMYQGQTPQSFNIREFMKLYQSLSDKEKEELTDAAKVFVLRDRKVKLVLGESFNMKITNSYDLKLANMLIKEFSYDK